MPYELPGTSQRSVPVGEVTLSVYEAGPALTDERPPIVLCHGFPELAYSWRHQVPALVAAGYRVVVPDQRGYGGSDRPAGIGAYDMSHLTGDLVGLLDAIGAARAVFVGHDWGGLVAWQMPLWHPERVAGVVGVNTPYLPRTPMPPIELFRSLGGEDNYIVFFQEPGVADELLASHTGEFLERLFRRAVDPARERSEGGSRSTNFIRRIVEGAAAGEPFLSPDELTVYVDTFTATGFTGGLNWYRNFDRNWELTPQLDGARIDGVPCLMITSAWDPVLRPELADPMVDLVGDLERHNIERCGHWTQQEQPAELNRLLLDWLVRRFP